MKESINFIKYRNEKHLIKLLIIDLFAISLKTFIAIYLILNFFIVKDENISEVASYAEEKLSQINIKASKIQELKPRFDSLLFNYNELINIEENRFSLGVIYGVLSNSIPNGVRIDSLVFDDFKKDDDYIVIKGTSESMNKLMMFSKKLSNKAKQVNFESKLVLFENKSETNDVYYEIIIRYINT